MALDFTPLENSVGQLEKSLRFAHSPLGQQDPDLFEQLRNSVNHCFEFTYELSHKMLRRFLKESAASPDDFESLTFAELIRTGNEQGLLRFDWGRWKAYRQARTDSSHTYDEKKAAVVYEVAQDFVEEARFLYEKLLDRSEVQ
jgi:nucleotidyltransferase substrate binding protein (TIGR01987 family)